MSSTTSDPSKPNADLPSVEVRTVVSFLIFVHFFALFAALCFTPGRYSQLGQRLASLPVLRQYRQMLDMNLPYTYQLTFGEEPTFQLEVDLELPDGSRKQVILPPQDKRLQTLQHRYEALADNVGMAIGDEMAESGLPQIVTAGLLDQNGATRANFRCRAHLPLGRDRVVAGADPNATETWETIYQAAIWRADDGSIRLLKQESASESAPGAAPNGNSPPVSVPSSDLPTSGAIPLPAPSNTALPPPDATSPATRAPASQSLPSERSGGAKRSPVVFPPSR